MKKGQDNLNNFIEKLPFVLTKSQEKALNKILKTMSLEKNLNILLQGDVGSGKTIIAFLAMYFATLNGHQCVFMAPTEVLAKQHYENAKKLFFEKNIKIAFLSGSLNEKQKRETIETIESGEANFIIGTHSVILNDIKYKNIGLVITDEQHRFSVNQRKTISSLSENLDIIIMSATPIPRTLALVVYGDMDIITLHEKPLNRLAIRTSLVPKHKISDMYEFIKKQFNQGGQAYFICPRIEDSESSNLVSVEKQFLELKKIFKDYKIAMLHGDIKSDEKNKIMSAFKQKEYDALVSTTVIEVGVDVKDACIIVVYDSDRFGLTQLHQLRGRVGRGDKQSYCFILSESENELSKKRLKIFTSTDDGFELSNQDFNLRGCGELLGNSQHGYINPVFKRLTIDGKVLQKCKELKEILLNTQNYFDFFNQTVKEEYKKDLNAVL